MQRGWGVENSSAQRGDQMDSSKHSECSNYPGTTGINQDMVVCCKHSWCVVLAGRMMRGEAREASRLELWKQHKPSTGHWEPIESFMQRRHNLIYIFKKCL